MKFLVLNVLALEGRAYNPDALRSVFISIQMLA